jgi:hypothetical protein
VAEILSCSLDSDLARIEPTRCIVFEHDAHTVNGVVVQNRFELKGQTLYIGEPFYKKYDTAPIVLQAHGDRSVPISFRDIWS